MSHFYGEVIGQAKTTASRCGSKPSGINAHIRGWNLGIKIVGEYDAEADQDVFRVYKTGGSHSPNEELVAEYRK